MNRNAINIFSFAACAALIIAALGLFHGFGARMWPGDGQWGMGLHHMAGGGMGGMGLGMTLLWVVLIAALAWLVAGALSGARDDRRSGGDPQEALEILKQRYARGEIDRDEYEDRRRTLSE